MTSLTALFLSRLQFAFSEKTDLLLLTDRPPAWALHR
jgi:hypothetical protein